MENEISELCKKAECLIDDISKLVGEVSKDVKFLEDYTNRKKAEIYQDLWNTIFKKLGYHQ